MGVCCVSRNRGKLKNENKRKNDSLEKDDFLFSDEEDEKDNIIVRTNNLKDYPYLIQKEREDYERGTPEEYRPRQFSPPKESHLQYYSNIEHKTKASLSPDFTGKTYNRRSQVDPYLYKDNLYDDLSTNRFSNPSSLQKRNLKRNEDFKLSNKDVGDRERFHPDEYKPEISQKRSLKVINPTPEQESGLGIFSHRDYLSSSTQEGVYDPSTNDTQDQDDANIAALRASNSKIAMIIRKQLEKSGKI